MGHTSIAMIDHFFIPNPHDPTRSDNQCVLCGAIDTSSAGEVDCPAAQFVDDWVEVNSDPYMKYDFKWAVSDFLQSKWGKRWTK